MDLLSAERWLEAQNLPDGVESDNDVRAARFHELVDREFLGVLTQEEARELEALTQWRDAEKAVFYGEIA